MNGVVISVLAFIVAIGVLVAVHEFGHFWVAKRFGIKVLRFSIGFGRPLFSRIGRDGTEFVVAAIPLGGYVKMLDTREGSVPDDQRHLAFDTQPVPTRMAVLIAGPAFNFLFAVFAYWLIFVLGVAVLRPVIGGVTDDSPAAQAGLMPEDEIVAVADRPVASWEAVVLAMLDEVLDDGLIDLRLKGPDGDERSAQIDVRGQEFELTEPGRLLNGIGVSFFSLPPVLGEVLPDSPAAEAGLQDGDLIVAADEQDISSWTELVSYIRARPGQEIVLEYERGGEPARIAVTLDSVEEGGTVYGRIGARVQTPEGLRERLYTEQKYGPIAAIGHAIGKTWDMSALTVRILWNMVSGDVSIRNISGPISIAQFAGDSARTGFTPFLRLLAIISISLGILNLLPIPLLDGGQLLYQTIELVKGSPLSERSQLIGQQIGIGLLIVLMGLAFYYDIARLLN